jgi:hypothetical protein
MRHITDNVSYKLQADQHLGPLFTRGEGHVAQY